MASYEEELAASFRITQQRAVTQSAYSGYQGTQGMEGARQISANVQSLLQQYPWLGDAPGITYQLARTNVVGAGAGELAMQELIRQMSKNPDKFDPEVRRKVARQYLDGQFRGSGGLTRVLGAASSAVSETLGFVEKYALPALPGGVLASPQLQETFGVRDAVESAQKGVVRGAMAGFQGAQDLVGSRLRGYATAASSEDLPWWLEFIPNDPAIGLPLKTDLAAALGYTGQENYEKVRENAQKAAGGGVLGEIAGAVAATTVPTIEQNTVGQIALAASRGEKIDLGSGYLPDLEGKIAKAQAHAARQYSPNLIGGSAWTPGRWIAGELFDPETTPFTITSGLIDAAVAWKADPAAAVLRGAAAKIAERKMYAINPQADSLQRTRMYLQELEKQGWFVKDSTVIDDFDLHYGIKGGRRPRLSRVDVLPWLHSEKTAPLMERIAQETSPARIWWAFGEKIPFELAEQLADASTPDLVRLRLVNELGTTIREVPDLNRYVPEMNRWLIDNPERYVDPNNLDASIRNIQGTLITAKASPELIARTIDDYAYYMAENQDFASASMIYNVIGAALTSLGVDAKTVSSMSRIFKNDYRATAQYWVEALTGNNKPIPLIVDNAGTEVMSDSPMLQIERFRGGYLLPDARELRAIANEMEFVRLVKTSGLVKTFGAAGDFFNTQIFKPFVLLRAAWTVRVLGEEMLRIAAGGSGGIFRHPFSYLLTILGDESNSRVTELVAGAVDRKAPIRRTLLDYFQGTGSLDEMTYQVLVEEISRRPGSRELLNGFYRGAGDPDLTPEELTRAVGAVVAESPLNRWNEFKRRVGVAAADVFDEPFSRDDEEALGAATSRAYSALVEGNIGFRDNAATSMVTLGYNKINYKAFANGVLENIFRFRQDADIRRALQATPDEFKAWGRTTEGMRRRANLASGRRPNDPMGQLASNDNVFDSWVDQIYLRIEDFTQNNQVLYNALRTGKFRRNNQFVNIFTSNGEVRPGAVRWMEALVEDPNQPTPEFLRILEQPKRFAGGYRSRLDRAVKFSFEFLGAKPTNFLNRSPEYRLWYWREMEDLVPRARLADMDRIEETLQNVNLLPRQKDRVLQLIAERRSLPETPNALSLETLDRVAKKRALDQVQSLLYDLSKRNQFADSVRVLFPFAEAWKEMATTWSRLLVEQPQIVPRFQQVYTGAREAEFNPITGLPTGEGVGFFHFDEQRQEEVFVYPGMGWLVQKLGLPEFPMVGSVKGLNMMSNGLPGVGPVVAVPANVFLPNKPKYDSIREYIFPYGAPEDKTDVLAYIAPAWLKRFRTWVRGPQSDRVYMNTVFDVARYLASSGEYQINGPDAQMEINRLFTDAKEKAGGLYLVRAATSFVAPSSPAFMPMVEDRDGNLIVMQKIIDDYRKMTKKARKEGRPNADAFDEFLEKYGIENVLLTQDKSTAKIPGLTSTVEQREWERNNADLVERFPNVWALFAPEGKEYDQTAYAAQIRSGQREAIPADTAIRRANNRLASHLYNRYRENLEDQPMRSSERQQLLRDFRQELLRNYPGYTEVPFVRDRDALIVQLEQALGEPQLANTVAGRGLSDYFQLRAAAQAKVRQYGLAWPPLSDDAAPLRDAMVRGADYLKAKYPGFSKMWDELLRYEFDVD